MSKRRKRKPVEEVKEEPIPGPVEETTVEEVKVEGEVEEVVEESGEVQPTEETEPQNYLGTMDDVLTETTPPTYQITSPTENYTREDAQVAGTIAVMVPRLPLGKTIVIKRVG